MLAAAAMTSRGLHLQMQWFRRGCGRPEAKAQDQPVICRNRQVLCSKVVIIAMPQCKHDAQHLTVQKQHLTGVTLVSSCTSMPPVGLSFTHPCIQTVTTAACCNLCSSQPWDKKVSFLSFEPTEWPPKQCRLAPALMHTPSSDIKQASRTAVNQRQAFCRRAYLQDVPFKNCLPGLVNLPIGYWPSASVEAACLPVHQPCLHDSIMIRASDAHLHIQSHLSVLLQRAQTHRQADCTTVNCKSTQVTATMYSETNPCRVVTIIRRQALC